MKRLLILFSVVLFSSVTVFATGDTEVEWNPNSTNCDCDAASTSKYKIYLRIVDVANNNVVVYEDFQFENTPATTTTFPTEDAINDHCEDISLTNIPNYTIYAYVEFYCEDTNPPELLCTGNGSLSNVSCYDYNLDDITVGTIILN